MYIILYEEEIDTGFHFVNIAKGEAKPRDGFKELQRREFVHHMDAVKYMLKERKGTAKYNAMLDPSYIPPSRR